MKGSLIIVGFFVLGALCGVYHLIPYDFTQSKLSFYALCALMFSVGVSVGNDPQTLRNFRSLNPRLIFLPVMTMCGSIATLIGAFGTYALRKHKFACTWPPVIANMVIVPFVLRYGYGFITEYKGPELGTIALLSNITREIITLLFAPLLVRWFGNLAPISAGGATTMDTTLPIITRYSGQSFVVVSIFHGFVVDFSVPFLVTLFCSI